MIFVRILAILACWQWGKLVWLGWMPSNGPAGVGQIRQERNAYYENYGCQAAKFCHSFGQIHCLFVD